MNGRLVKLVQLSAENQNRISVSDLQPGIYVVWVIGEGKVLKGKLIKR